MTYQIVVGVDGSNHAGPALHWAFDQAALLNGAVTALFAWQFPLIGIPGAFDRDTLESEAKAFLADVVASAGAPPAGVTINQVVAQGEPSESLVHACETLDADLLVLGTRQRGGFTGLPLDAALQCRCPVVIVKPRVTHP